MPDCEHDWRVNPHIQLLSAPPQQVLICAKCHARTTRVTPDSWPLESIDDWPKA
jgi:hypothetical protein